MATPIDDALLEALLAADAPDGDLTTDALGIAGRPGRIVFRARAEMTVAGVEIAAAMLRRRGASIALDCRSGEGVAAGAQILSGQGDAAGLHLA
jgi:molybdenum transport protein